MTLPDRTLTDLLPLIEFAFVAVGSILAGIVAIQHLRGWLPKAYMSKLASIQRGVAQEIASEVKALIPSLLTHLSEIKVPAEDENGQAVEVPFLAYIDSRLDGLGEGLMQGIQAQVESLKQEALPFMREAVQAIASAAASGKAKSNSRLGVAKREQNAMMRDMVKAAVVQGASNAHPLGGVVAGTLMDSVPEIGNWIVNNPEAAAGAFQMIQGRGGNPSQPQNVGTTGPKTTFRNGHWE